MGNDDKEKDVVVKKTQKQLLVFPLTKSERCFRIPLHFFVANILISVIHASYNNQK